MPVPTDVHSRRLLRTSGDLPGVVLQPDGLKLGPGVYRTLSEAINALKTQYPGQATELAVAPQGGPWEIEAGTYDFDNDGQPIILTNGLKVGSAGPAGGVQSQLNLAEGAVFTRFTRARGVTLRKEVGATPVIEFTESGNLDLVDVSLIIQGTATGPLVRVVDTSNVLIEGRRLSITTALEDVPALDFLDAGQINLVAYDHSYVGRRAMLFDPAKGLRITADDSVLLHQDNQWPDEITNTVVNGNAWYEVPQVPVSERSVLTSAQLAAQEKGGVVIGVVLQGALIFLVNQPTAGQTLNIGDGTTTDTLTAVAGAPGADEFQIGGSADATLANLVASILANSTVWGAVYLPTLKGQWSTTEGPAAVIYRRDQVALSYPDRLWGTLANLRSVAFLQDRFVYDWPNAQAIPTTDPARRTFFGWGSNQRPAAGQIVATQAERQLWMARTHPGPLGAGSVAWTWLAGRRVTPIQTAAFTAKGGDIVQCDPTAGGFTVTMPIVGPADNGVPVTVKNASANTNTVTVAANTGATIQSGGNLAAANAVSNYYYDGINAVWRLQQTP